MCVYLSACMCAYLYDDCQNAKCSILLPMKWIEASLDGKMAITSWMEGQAGLRVKGVWPHVHLVYLHFYKFYKILFKERRASNEPTDLLGFSRASVGVWLLRRSEATFPLLLTWFLFKASTWGNCIRPRLRLRLGSDYLWNFFFSFSPKNGPLILTFSNETVIFYAQFRFC